MSLPNLSALSLRCLAVDGKSGEADEPKEDPNDDALKRILADHSKRSLENRRKQAAAEEARAMKKRRGPLACVPRDEPPAEQPRAEPPPPGGGWRLKQRALEKPARGNERMLDFSFENPANGKFKDLPAVKKLLKDYPGQVRQVFTSYCHYGYSYQKPTVFVTSLPGFRPKLPCPQEKCMWLQEGRTKHPSEVLCAPVAQKNSLPPELIDTLINSWMARHEGQASEYLLVDVFSGWGSVQARVLQNQFNGKWPNLRTYSNDLEKRDHTDTDMDMSAHSTWTLSTLLALAVRKHWQLQETEQAKHPDGAMGWIRENKIAVLFHCSTPCSTYSTAGLSKHRKGSTLEPLTDTARDHDAMNAKLIQYFRDNVLSQPSLTVSR